MPPRKTWTVLPGAQSARKPSRKRTRESHSRALDAYGLAEAEVTENAQIAKYRLASLDHDTENFDPSGEFERDPKRAKGRPADDDQHEDDSSAEDSGTNEWWNGKVNPDDDSEIDSDEAFGDSDDEIETYKFGQRKRYTRKGKKQSGGSSKHRKTADGDDSNESDEEDYDLGDDGAALGDEGVDLATMLDHNSQDGSESSDDQESGSEDADSDSGSDSDSQQDVSDDSEAEDLADTGRLADLHDIIDSLHPTASVSKQTAFRELSSKELGPVSEHGVQATKKLSLSDMFDAVPDKGMRKSLKIVAKKSKPSNTAGSMPGKLSAPLPPRKQAELDRAAATKATNTTLGEWVDTVKHNRRAEHLAFPIVDSAEANPQGEATFLPSAASKPMNDLEASIQSILVQSGLGPGRSADDDAAKAFDQLEEKKMTVEEVMAARAAIQKQRDLLFREEIRAKRIKKIKSKSYRRVHRKDKERAAELEREGLIAAGVDLSEEEREKNDRKRAEERMGAKHRDSKWAKSMKKSGRTVWDDDARTGVNEMARQNDELRRRIEGKVVGRDNSDDDSEFDNGDLGFDSSDDDETARKAIGARLDLVDDLHSHHSSGPGSRLASLKFMQKAEAARIAQNEAETAELRQISRGDASVGSSDEDEDDAGRLPGRKSFGPSQTVSNRGQDTTVPRRGFEEAEEMSDEDDGHVNINHLPTDGPARSSTLAASTLKSANSDSAKPTSDQPSSTTVPWSSSAKVDKHAKTENSPRRPALSLKDESQKNKQSKRSRQTTLDGPSVRLDTGDQSDSDMVSNENQHSHVGSHSPSNEARSEKMAAALKSAVVNNQAMIQQAFGTTDVEAEFEREKKQTIANEEEKVIDNTMPGWGSWTGQGMSTKSKNKNNKTGRNKTASKFTTTIAGVKAKNRKDANLKNVIINEKSARKTAPYQADTLPFPFKSRDEYERSLRMPIGSEWTSMKSKPRVTVKPGVVIKPLRKPLM